MGETAEIMAVNPISVEGFIVTILNCRGYWRHGKKIINGVARDEPERAATVLVQEAIKRAMDNGNMMTEIRVLVNAELAVRLHLERRLGWNHENEAKWNGSSITIPRARFEPVKNNWVSTTVIVVEELKPDVVVI